MTIGIWILGDQLYVKQAALESCFNQENVPVILIESLHDLQVRPYHQQKLVLILTNVFFFKFLVDLFLLKVSDCYIF
ncbi:cryptochrome/photolyase family protein [Nostoc sp.]|uniref:cryptochrome/photolyase family protein n=1 Tax=Nostoc sp. TaxID=1180 RepID=UPI003FA5679D